MTIKKKHNQLSLLMNVGKATLQDLSLLNITTVAQLAEANPDELYTLLEKITGCHQDPCVWDVFAAIIHEAQTGEKLPWWQWTAMRKARLGKQKLCLHDHKK